MARRDQLEMAEARERSGVTGTAAQRPGGPAPSQTALDAFRRWGYLQADVDPLGFLKPAPHPELDAIPETEARQARSWYCGSIGVEFMHIPDPVRRAWVQETMEQPEPTIDQRFVLERLARAEIFEEVLHGRYLGTKRFSIEGVAAVIPFLDETLESGAARGLEEVLIAMSHRGRLNVMVHVVGRSPVELFAGFEDIDPKSVLGGGDVKYHLGATGWYTTREGRKVRVKLVSNPSHLEAVDPVAEGRVRARQDRIGEDGRRKVVPVVLHGDAAFAGQGILAEVLNYSELPGFAVGGTIHLVVNNQIGFTTSPRDLHATRFPTDQAKRLPIPIFHVNGEDLGAVVRVARMAVEFRYRFEADVVVDLIGYRRHGHSEVDDPTITQPRLYKAIERHRPLWKLFAERTGLDPGDLAARVRAGFEAAQVEAGRLETRASLAEMPDYWAPYFGGCHSRSYEVDTGVPRDVLREAGRRLTSVPEGFNIHPKVKRLLEQRREMAEGRRLVDFGMAEALAFATLVREGIPVRFSGQDSRRGTFNQRHAALIDVETEDEYMPLAHVSPGQARIEIYNSTLSEAAPLGFEYGYSRDYPEALVMWEAQFGDFANSAQVVIDQFISAGEDKWGLLSGVVLLLPHGYEGQGPEHSSARIERFLHLAAEDNLQVCQPSTAAQYFHLLRRQALRRWRKPLVVFTPKSTLRHQQASSSIEELTHPRFKVVLPDEEHRYAARVLICTGKIAHELRAERRRRQDESTAIVTLEQLYPFPVTALKEELGRFEAARDIVWVQEEPKNMGALFYVLPRLRTIAGNASVRAVRRAASASPATGSARAHGVEQKALVALAFASSREGEESD